MAVSQNIANADVRASGARTLRLFQVFHFYCPIALMLSASSLRIWTAHAMPLNRTFTARPSTAPGSGSAPQRAPF